MGRKKDIDLDQEEENISEKLNEKEHSIQKVHHLAISYDTWKKLIIRKLKTDKEFHVMLLP